jgi:hypothetical protein
MCSKLIIIGVQWEHNKRLMSEIVAAQRCGPDGLPLFLHDSAANPDPSLIPSQASVSLLHVTTPTEFAKLPKLLQQQIFRNRCLLFNDVRRDDLPKAFDEETLEQYRELDSLTEIQGVFFIPLIIRGTANHLTQMWDFAL